jgi:hypothetical protein
MSRITKAAGIVLGTGAMVLGGAGLAVADAGAQGAAVHSPGVLSGNLVQVPVNIPINLCGNTVNVIGLLNPAFGNNCVNHSDGTYKGDDGKGHDDGKNDDGKDEEGGYGYGS